ncbi:hypothetical protein M885DRAFT_510547 [Pelagophyceae sp. CCMP2097]|nr:hypothetical protein M885DRAFT_510547 [Pelagophyceae sp. CCMP2097]
MLRVRKGTSVRAVLDAYSKRNGEPHWNGPVDARRSERAPRESSPRVLGAGLDATKRLRACKVEETPPPHDHPSGGDCGGAQSAEARAGGAWWRRTAAVAVFVVAGRAVFGHAAIRPTDGGDCGDNGTTPALIGGISLSDARLAEWVDSARTAFAEGTDSAWGTILAAARLATTALSTASRPGAEPGAPSCGAEATACRVTIGTGFRRGATLGVPRHHRRRLPATADDEPAAVEPFAAVSAGFGAGGRRRSLARDAALVWGTVAVAQLFPLAPLAALGRLPVAVLGSRFGLPLRAATASGGAADLSRLTAAARGAFRLFVASASALSAAVRSVASHRAMLAPLTAAGRQRAAVGPRAVPAAIKRALARLRHPLSRVPLR